MAVSKRAEENDEEFAFRWTLDDNNRPVVLSEDRLSVQFHPTRSTCCCAVRGDKPLRVHMEHWFEVEMEAPFQGQARMVGLGDKTTRLQSSSKDFFPLIGRDVSSWGINYDGVILHDGNRLPYADVDTTHDKPLRIGVYYDSYHGYITFSIDDKNYGVAFNNVTIGLELFPMICSTSRNSNVKLIYSHSSIISLKALCRGSIRLYIKEIKDIESLPIPIHQKSYLLFKNYEMPKSIKDYIIV